MMKEQSSLSYLYGTNVPYIEDLYEAYLSSPDSVDSQWRQYFDQVAAMPGNTPKDVAHRPIQEAFANLAQQRGGAPISDNCPSSIPKPTASLMPT